MPRLAIDDRQLAEFCQAHHIRKLALIGSVLKGTARPDSDIDLLVEFESDATPSLLDMVAMEQALSAMLGGQFVDLRTPRDLSRYFRDEIVQTAGQSHEG